MEPLVSKKKVLIFSLAYEPFLGGAEIAIREITKRIGDDFSFDMITARFDSTLPCREQIGNITVYRVGFSKKSPTHEELVRFPLYLVTKVFYVSFAFLKAISLYRQNHYDMFWVMMAYAGFPVVFFRRLYAHVPYLLTLQEGDSIEYMTRRWRIRPVSFFLKQIFREAKQVQTISSYLGRYATAMGFKGIPQVIPNGIDFKSFSTEISDSEKRNLKSMWGIQEGDKVIITTSRLVKKNAVGDVIKALLYLPPQVKFLIAGAGPLEFSLKKLVEENTLKERVFFLGNIPYADLPRYYKVADVFIRPSLSEGMGSSFIEAMGASIPIVGTAVGGIVDFLKNGETGFIAEVQKPESIAEQVRFIIDPSNKMLVERVVKNARDMIEKKYDWNIIADSMKTIFNKTA